jgi:hypothetical protein
MRFKEYLTESPYQGVYFTTEVYPQEIDEIPWQWVKTQIAEKTKIDKDFISVSQGTAEIIYVKIKIEPSANIKEIETIVTEVFTTLEDTYCAVLKGTVQCFGIPNYKISWNYINITLTDKNMKLTGISKVIIGKDLMLTIELCNNWIGGILDIFNMDNIAAFYLQRTSHPKHDEFTKKMQEFISKHLSNPNLDKWDAQEELEKDKSTKPFASE